MNTATESTPTTDTPRAWVGCLGCYNNGDLVGQWLTAAECDDLVGVGLQIRTHDEDGELNDLCARCGAEELWVMDHEGLPTAVLSGECSPMQFHELATEWETVDSPEMVAAYLDNMGETVTVENLAELVGRAQECFTGYATVIEYADEFLEDSGDLKKIPPYLRRYIDTEAFARDLVAGGDVSECDGYVFRNY